jgi:glycosyltransferase involved in cell wall biosynthesis
MKILEVSRYKNNFADHQLPFVTEQGESLRAAGCEVEYFLVKGSYLLAVRDLKKKIREFKPDIVHAHYGLSAITAELQSLAPVVTTFHNGETLNPLVNFASSLMSLRAKHVIYVAQHVRDLSYFKAKNYSVIACGVPMEQMTIIPKEETRKRLGWDANKKYILFGGAFDNLRKNYPLLKQAVDILNLKLETLNPKSCIEIVEMRGLTREQCVLRMNAVDLFALPSHSEGSPQALKEAMTCNCPCLATDIADVRYLFGDEPGHWILRNPRKTHERWDGDEKSLDEMVALLKEALAFEGRTNGRQRILDLELSNEQVAKRIIEIYKTIVKK